MRIYVASTLACFFFSGILAAAEWKGRVVDPSGAPVAGAQISLISPLGVDLQTTSAPDGSFQFAAPDQPQRKLSISAPGFRTAVVAPENVGVVQLEIAPRSDAIQVVASAIAVPASEQGGSVSIIGNQEIRRRNEPLAVDLLRYIPGVAFSQTGATGGVAGLFLRGGYANFNLVEIDGVPVNSFGGSFDFAHVPTESLDHIEVIRGPQSAIAGPYANSGVIDFVTRRPEGSAHLDIVAEGGTYRERRFGISASGTFAGLGIAASASRMDTDGPVANSDYRNENVMLNISRRWGRHSIFLHGNFDSNEAGEPGPWGSDPAHTFTGIDLISRAKNNESDYSARYSADLSARVREELIGSFFLENSGFQSAYPFAFNKDVRGQGEARTTVSVSPHYTAVIGAVVGREEVKNSYVLNAAFEPYLIPRTDIAGYVENRFVFGSKVFLNAGIRGEALRTPAIPPDGPVLPKNTMSSVNPRVSAAYLLTAATRLHAAAATGMRPPNGFELAFTDNPALRPERTRSVEAGLERRLFHDALLLDGTYFYNRFYDLIVTLGGSLARLSRYESANLANSRAHGMELSASLRPVRWIYVTGSYTLLNTRILSLDGSTGLAPTLFAVGQPLTRRPRNSGNFVATFTKGRIAADLTGYFRGRSFFEEPSLGAYGGLFWNPGYSNIGVNVNYFAGRGLTLYANLRNALNQHYEEVLGYPSPRLNFVSGVKWNLPGRKQ